MFLWRTQVTNTQTNFAARTSVDEPCRINKRRPTATVLRRHTGTLSLMLFANGAQTTSDTLERDFSVRVRCLNGLKKMQRYILEQDSNDIPVFWENKVRNKSKT